MGITFAMDYEAGEYQKLVVRQYPPRALRETAEGRYWRQFKAPVVAQQVGLVFCPKVLSLPAARSTCMQSGSSCVLMLQAHPTALASVPESMRAAPVRILVVFGPA